MIKIFTLAVALVFAAATGVDAQKVGHMSSQEVFLERKHYNRKSKMAMLKRKRVHLHLFKSKR